MREIDGLIRGEPDLGANAKDATTMMNHKTPRWTRDEIARARAGAFDAALRLASNDGITSVHVFTNRRPTYPELLHLRHEAIARELELAVSGSGVAIKRRQHPATSEAGWPIGALRDWAEQLRERARASAATAPTAAAGRAGDPALPLPLRQWLNAHGQEWRAGLAALSEGTR
jgi:hypothetical protein